MRRAAKYWSPAAISAAAPRANTRPGRCWITASARCSASEIADIFRSNALKNGLLAVVLSEAEHRIPAQAPGHRTGHRHRRRHASNCPTAAASASRWMPSRGTCLLQGVDQIGYPAQQHAAQIDAFEAQPRGAPMKASIVLLPGDGIGPEVTAAAVEVLQAVGDGIPPRVRIQTNMLIGGCAIDATGEAAARRDPRRLPGRRCGPAGRGRRSASGRTRKPRCVPNRACCNCAPRWACSPICARCECIRARRSCRRSRPERLAGVDLLFVRELTGGSYFGKTARATPTAPATSAVIPWPRSSASLRRAFELARSRRGQRHLDRQGQRAGNLAPVA